MPKYQGFIDGAEKFSLFINSNAAAAISPTTAGRRPDMMLCTTIEFMYFMNNRQIRIIRMNDGSTSARVAVALPSTAIVSPMAALCTAV